MFPFRRLNFSAAKKGEITDITRNLEADCLLNTKLRFFALISVEEDVPGPVLVFLERANSADGIVKQSQAYSCVFCSPFQRKVHVCLIVHFKCV